jgi:hypothetical protein
MLPQFRSKETCMNTSAAPSQEEGGGPNSATVTVKGFGLEVVGSVDKATMLNVVALILGTAPSASPRLSSDGVAESGGIAPSVGGGAETRDPDVTLGEFLADSGASTFPQKICAAGYYLIKIRGDESFDRDGIRAALEAAHEDMPGNFPRDFAKAASSNLISQLNVKGKYIVPTTGRNAVASHFTDVPKPRAKNSRKAVTSNSETTE